MLMLIYRVAAALGDRGLQTIISQLLSRSLYELPACKRCASMQRIIVMSL